MELDVYTFAELTPDSSGGPLVTPQQPLRDLIELLHRELGDTATPESEPNGGSTDLAKSTS